MSSSSGENLMPDSLKIIVPAICGTSEVSLEMKVVYARLYHPDTFWNWFVFEYDSESETFFGMVSGLYNELGYFNKNELEANGVLYDVYFKPTRYKDVAERFGLV